MMFPVYLNLEIVNYLEKYCELFVGETSNEFASKIITRWVRDTILVQPIPAHRQQLIVDFLCTYELGYICKKKWKKLVALQNKLKDYPLCGLNWSGSKLHYFGFLLENKRPFEWFDIESFVMHSLAILLEKP